MKKEITNPLNTLKVDELTTFSHAIDKNFRVVTFKGEVKEDLHTRWSELYNDCLKYAYDNYEKITEKYPYIERTYGDVVKIMILQEMDKKVEL